MSVVAPPAAAQARPTSWAGLMLAAFGAAAIEVGGIVERSYRIGGQSIRLRFAGPALIPKLVPALGHLAHAASSERGLTIYAWDSASTATPPPAGPWGGPQSNGAPQTYVSRGPRVFAVYCSDIHLLYLVDLELNVAFVWCERADAIPYYESGSPARVIFHWWMGARGLHLAHAALIGVPDSGALVIGKGGSGKSNTALACLEAGMLFGGDDHCLVRTEGAPFAYSLYGSAKLNGGDLERFPRLRPLVANPERLEEDKALVLLHPTRAAQLVDGLPLRAVLLPCITGWSGTRIALASGSSTLLALAPSTILLAQFPRPHRGALAALAALVRAVPCYRLELGTDPAEVAETVKDFLAGG